MNAKDAEEKFNRGERAWRNEHETKEPDVDGVGLINYSGGPVPRNKALDTGFYGHILPSHFEKTAIIKTTGRFK